MSTTPAALLPDATVGRRAHSARRAPRIVRYVERALMGVVALVLVTLLAVVVGPRFFPYEALVVRSGSMAPTLPIGSVVFYHHEAAADVKVGQIILFAEPDNPSVKITHRVYRVVDAPAGTYFETKGDANAVPDAWHVQAAGVGWVASFHVPFIGYPFAMLSSRWAKLALVTVPALALGSILLLEQIPGRRRKDEAATT